MKQLIFFSILCLMTTMQACAESHITIAQMTTTSDSVKIHVEWTGAGSIYANGVELKNDINLIAATADSLVTLTATGDAQLTHLHCSSNQLTALDITNGTKLEALYCIGNYLTTLDVTNCPELKVLQCHYNSLSALDITNCPKLKIVSASHQTISLPVARIDDDRLSIKSPFAGSKVKIDNVSDNGIDTGDSLIWVRERESGKVTFDFTAKLPNNINGHPLFGTVTLPWTKTKSSKKMETGTPIVTMTTTDDSVRINVKWTGAGKLIANGVELKNSDVTENIIYPSIDGLVRVIATGDAQLTHLKCWRNSLTDLDITNCPGLTHLNCEMNDLTTLDVTNCPNLIELSCGKTYQIAVTYMSNFLDLANMYGHKKNSLTALDLTNCTELTRLSCHDNSLTTLDLTNCPKLKYLNCEKNDLTILDVTNCTELTELNCRTNRLTVLDVTNCTKLTTLNCDRNFLTTLNIDNCMELTSLDCDNNSLQALDVTNCRKLRDLSCSGNSLTALDVTNCILLESLSCNNNSLTVLDVTKCPKLMHLYCHNNTLSALSLDNCWNLERLFCSDNSLSNLDVSKCPKLRDLFASNQAPVLPVVQPNDTELSIINPVSFTGSKMSIDSISHSGTYADGRITWDVSGESGEVTFYFTTKESQVTRAPFSGTATLPWTRKMKAKRNNF